MGDLLDWDEGKMVDVLRDIIPSDDQEEYDFDLTKEVAFDWLFKRYCAMLLQFDCIEGIIESKVNSQIESIRHSIEEKYKEDMDSIIVSRDKVIQELKRCLESKYKIDEVLLK